MDLTEFLAARLDEDESAANGCMNCGRPIRRGATSTGYTHGRTGGDWQGVRCPGKITGALPWPDPARVLREVEAKRRILERHRDCGSGVGYCDDGGHGSDGEDPGCAEMEDLAAPYSDHPDYDPSWSPGAIEH